MNSLTPRARSNNQILSNQPILTNQQMLSNADQSDGLDLRKLFDVLAGNVSLIAGIAIIVTLLGLGYVWLAKPIYEATILIQVEDASGSANNAPGDLLSTSRPKTAVASEIEVLRSRMVVSPAIDTARLYIKVQPDYFPIIGERIARRNTQLSEPGLLGYGGYVWGTERAEVSLFNVPEDLEGDVFVLTAMGNDSYNLRHLDLPIQINGRVGEELHVETPEGTIDLRVDHLAGKAGAQFSLVRIPRLEAVERMQDALKIIEKRKESGIIGVALEGSDRKLTANILTEIGREYLRQNEYRKSEAAEKSLAFLEAQLPVLKQELERSEERLNELRTRRGTFDLREEAKGILQQSVSVQSRMSELNQKKVELLQRFQNAHPAVESIDQQLQVMSRELQNVNTKIGALPEMEQDVLRLSRDVKVNTDVYTSVLSTAQQLRLVRASKVGNVRLLDPAETPVKPIKPHGTLVILVAGVVGLFLGVIGAFTRKSLLGRVEDPQEIERTLGLPVTATIPHSVTQGQLSTQIRHGSRELAVLQHFAPTDSVVESLRRFRTSLKFAMLGSKNNIIVITGPTPNVGKSFVSANFAAVLASIGKTVLLIDGDLRSGQLHRYFGLERKAGLSDLIIEEATLEQVIQKEAAENVDFLSSGNLPSKPAELLAHKNFGKMLQIVSSRYDFVLIDTPPVLPVSDALVVGIHAGAIFNIVRSGVTTVNDIEESVKRFNRAGIAVTGVVFNDSKARTTRYENEMKYKYGGFRESPQS